MAGIRLNPSFAIVHTAAGVVLRSDLATFQLDGPDARVFVDAIVPLLDGSHTREAIAEALTEYSRPSVLKLLDRLEKHRVLQTLESPHERWLGQTEFFRQWTRRPEESMDRLGRAGVLIVGLEPWGVAAAAELAAAGVGTLHILDDGSVAPGDLAAVRLWRGSQVGRPRREALAEALAEAAPWCRVTAGPPTVTEAGELAPPKADWHLVVGTGGRDQLGLFRSVARYAQARNIRSLYGCIDGLEAVVGPAVLPGKTACWNCARLRRLANVDRPAETHALQTAFLAQHGAAPLHTYLAPAAPLVGHLVALEALKLLSGYTPSHLVGRILVQDLVTLETTSHVLIRMPWCEVCGGARGGGGSSGEPAAGRDKIGADPPALGSAEPGQFRRAMAGWVDTRTGVVKDLLVIRPDATEPELPVTCAAILSSYADDTRVPHDMDNASGKGLSVHEAMVGAVGEAIERYSAARQPAGLRRAALNELSGDVLDPRRLCLYDDAQYNAPGFPFVRFDPGRPIAWTKGRWLDTGQPVWVPALLTYLHWPEDDGEAFCQITSNGLAAGVDFDDAALRAVVELVERDAFMTAWLTRRPGRKLLVDDAVGAGTREVVRQLGERGVEVECFLLEGGVRIPVVACLGLGDGRRWPSLAVGLGAHLSPVAAARRAILELGKNAAYLHRLMADGATRIPRTTGEVRTNTDHALYYAPKGRARAIGFLRRGGRAPRRLSALRAPADVSLRVCVARLNAAGVRAAVVDVTSPDVAGSPFRVARGLATGLQPLDFGFRLRRTINPRLGAMLTGRVNPHPHPLT
ncbi:MAG: TOMM precursor leader peptide-binding protein [bacterium]